MNHALAPREHLAGPDSALPHTRITRGAAVRSILVLALISAFGFELAMGSMSISPGQALGILAEAARLEFGVELGTEFGPAERTVLLSLRLPRALGTGLVGAALATTGVALQGMFRNPLADPQLIGVTMGAAVGSAATIVLGAPVLAAVATLGFVWLNGAAISAAAVLGAWLTSIVVYALASVDGRPSVTHMLLAGIAVTAFGGAVVGLLQYLADDVELRDLSLWMLGDLGRLGWGELPWLVIGLGPAILVLARLGPDLDVSLLGDDAAHDLGVDVVRLRRRVVSVSALAVGVAVACSGPIAFVGLAVPHVLRLINGPRHRALVIDAALLGATLLLTADAIARTVVSPAELPVGILTAFIGAPLFVSLLLDDLRRERRA